MSSPLTLCSASSIIRKTLEFLFDRPSRPRENRASVDDRTRSLSLSFRKRTDGDGTPMDVPTIGGSCEKRTRRTWPNFEKACRNPICTKCSEIVRCRREKSIDRERKMLGAAVSGS
ncbi:hypothetical protein MTP99_019123 [Tenebrio molitor]|nr:hypothetical protein MTP99_019123 [Tenebrio molitor]